MMTAQDVPTSLTSSYHCSSTVFEVLEDTRNQKETDTHTCVLEIKYKNKLTGSSSTDENQEEHGTVPCVDCRCPFNPSIQKRKIKIKWTISTAATFSSRSTDNYMDCDDTNNVMESFVTFVLGILEREEPGIISNMDKLYDELDENPFAEIVVLLPTKQKDKFTETEDDPYFKARLGLLQKRRGGFLSNLANFEAYDILTDNHLIDVLELIDETNLKHTHLPPARICFILNQQVVTPNSSIPTHIRCYSCRDRRQRKISTRLRNAVVNTYVQVIQKLTRRSRFHSTSNQGLYNLLKKASAFKTLVKTGLYSPRYIEHQLCEIYDSIVNSVTAGFSNTRGFGW